MIYFLKKDMEQLLEIKCDLDVTAHMGNRDKAEYLATIVAMLKNAEAKKEERLFLRSGDAGFRKWRGENC